VAADAISLHCDWLITNGRAQLHDPTLAVGCHFVIISLDLALTRNVHDFPLFPFVSTDFVEALGNGEKEEMI
jgi:hypothetical protein